MKPRISHLLLSAVALISICLSSCDDERINYDDFSYKDREEYSVDSVFFRQPCFISGSIPNEVAEVLSTAFTLRSTVEEAEVAILTSEDLDSMSGEIDRLLQEESMLVIYDPDASKVRSALSSRLPAVNNWDLSGLGFLAVNRFGESCMMPRIPALIYEDVCPLVKWVSQVYPSGDDISDILNFKLATTSIPYKLKDKEITHVILSHVDRLSGNGAITLNLNVCPLHGYGAQVEDGYDYYIIKAQVSVESNQMYSGNFYKMHGGVKARICGFYLKGLTYDVILTDAQGKSVGEFCTVPLPATISGSTTYNDSFGFNLSGALSGAVENCMVGAGLTYSSSVQNTIPDVSLFNNHHDNVASYTLSMGNLPHYLAKIAISDPPASAVSTLDINTSWVWRVKVPDGDDQQYKVTFNVRDMLYGASYFYSSGADFHNLDFEIPNASQTLSLPAPGRVATGKVSINCLSGVLDYVSLVSQSTGKEYKKTDDHETFEFVVPEGEYSVRFAIGGVTYVYDKIIDVPRCGNVFLNTGYGFIKAE